MYSWHDIAERTVRGVYAKISAHEPTPLIQRLENYCAGGPVAGKLFCVIAVLDVLIHFLLCWLWPVKNIDIALNFDMAKYVGEETCRPSVESGPVKSATDCNAEGSSTQCSILART